MLERLLKVQAGLFSGCRGFACRSGEGRQCPLNPGYTLLELTLFVLLAVFSTWPLATQLGQVIPTGQERVATVPLFNLWTIWWNADRAGEGFANYWDAPIFAPIENAFVLSETQPTTVVVAPVVWVTGSRALAYNLYLLTMLVANGWAGSILVRSLTCNRFVGTCSGAVMLLLPFVHWQLGVLQLSQVSGILLTLHFLIRFLTGYKMKDAALLGAAVGFCYLACNYYGYQLCLTLLFALPVLVVKRCCFYRVVAGFVIASVAASVMVLPVVAMQLSASNRQNWDRRAETVYSLSAVQADYFRTLWRGPLSNSAGSQARFPLSPGLACSVLAIVGAFVGLRQRDTRRVTMFLLMFLAVAAQLSLGPGWVFLGQRPFELLVEWLPGLSAMRSPHRFAVLVQVSCVILAGMSFVQASSNETINNKAAGNQESAEELVFRRERWRRTLQWGQVALLCGMVIELWPAKPDLYAMPEYEQQRPWVEWLRTRTQADDVVAHLPFPRGRSVSDYEGTAIAMLWSTCHKRRLANGDSGFFPSEFVQLKRDVQGFPDDRSVLELRKAGVRWCVVDTSRLSPANVEKLSGQRRLSIQFETVDRKTRIYAVEPVDEFDGKPDRKSG
ncbi:MAG: hypothetical protein O2983_07755 [Planctomycetota bacterium]|nr:hypothetical protein [Planctomycetota bacterium]